MKHIINILFIVIILIAIPVLVSAQNCNNLEGAWVMVHMEVSSDDTSFVKTQEDANVVKILADNHFAYGYIQDLGGNSSINAGGGMYTYDHNTYTEKIKYHYVTDIIDNLLTFDCRVEGNRWYQEAFFPESPFGNNLQMQEVWQRVDRN